MKRRVLIGGRTTGQQKNHDQQLINEEGHNESSDNENNLLLQNNLNMFIFQFPDYHSFFAPLCYFDQYHWLIQLLISRWLLIKKRNSKLRGFLAS